MIERVIFAGGGTGGHLFPGIAVYEELRRREPELETLFVGTARGIETRVIPELGERLECLEVAPLKGRTPGQLIKNLGALPQAGLASARIIRRFRPSLVLGVGGYAAGPMVAAAAALGVPTALLEQNAHVGLTNRLLSRLVRRAYLTFEETAELFPASSVRVVGNPVRQSLVAEGRMASVDPAGFEMRARRVLVIGGSQGARALNEIVPEALAAALGGRGVEVLHQAGHTMCDVVREHYSRLGVRATVVPFIDDMAKAYASAAIVIGRAGATSIAELCAVGRPSILVPFPQAADDHQWHNARALQAQGAAVAIRESDLTPAALSALVSDLLASEQKRLAMAEAARRMGRPDAAAAIVDDLCGWLGCASGTDQGDRDGGGEPSDQSDGAGEQRATGPILRRAFPPDAQERLAMSRRRARRRSVAWGQVDSYYGTKAVAALE